MDPRAFIVAVMAARDRLPFGKRPTRDHVEIARKLAFWQGAAPSHQQLANATHTSRRTVIRALKRLHALGLLTWTRRVVAGRGWRAQIANSYAFSQSSLSFLVLRTSATLSQPAPALDLAAITARRTARFNSQWQQRRVK